MTNRFPKSQKPR